MKIQPFLLSDTLYFVLIRLNTPINNIFFISTESHLIHTYHYRQICQIIPYYKRLKGNRLTTLLRSSYFYL